MEPNFQANLSVVESTGKVLKSTEVQKDQTVGVQISDQIEMASESRSFLNISDFLEVEIFRNAQVLLADVQQESGGSTEATLRLNQGHIFVRLHDEATSSRVNVETPYAMIRAREDGTDFDVCHNEVLTCVWIKKGVAEVIAKDKRVFVREGEASYIKKDQPPSAAICAPVETISVWEEEYRASADAPLLGQVVSQLPQEPCAPTEMGIPPDANIRYQEDFTNPSSGWLQGTIDDFLFSYLDQEYYQIQILGPNNEYPVYVPNKMEYTDVNIDLVAHLPAGSKGDIRYGVVFRRSGDLYYAFTLSPPTKKWYFLKGSSNGLETLKEGTEENIQGLEAMDALRVMAAGPTFSLHINGRIVDQVTDSDYISGEIGLFAQTGDSPEALVYFDSITIWGTEAPLPNSSQGGREICFNERDDDGDGLTDRADPDCERPDPEPTTYP